MDNPRPEKVAVVDEVRDRLRSSSAAILTEYRGLRVKDLQGLRRTLRAAGSDYKIYKNTLVRLAVSDLGLENLVEVLEGPTAIAFVDGDAVGVAKTLRDFARSNPNLVVKGGVLGTKILSAADAAALADVPPREVLLARLAGGLAAPLQQLAGLLQALPRNFAYGLKALVDKRGGPDAGQAAGSAPTPGDLAAESPLATEPTTAEPTTAEPTTAEGLPAESPAPDATAEPPGGAASETEPPVADGTAALADSPAPDASSNPSDLNTQE